MNSGRQIFSDLVIGTWVLFMIHVWYYTILIWVLEILSTLSTQFSFLSTVKYLHLKWLQNHQQVHSLVPRIFSFFLLFFVIPFCDTGVNERLFVVLFVTCLQRILDKCNTWGFLPIMNVWVELSTVIKC